VPLQVPTLRRLGLAAGSRRSRRPRRARAAGPSAGWRSLAGQGLGDRPLGADGARARSPVSGLPRGFPRPHRRSSSAGSAAARSATPASGTAIIEELGAEHLATGKPIVYTSADSVFQIAAHEDVVPMPSCIAGARIAYDLSRAAWASGGSSRARSSGVPGAFRRTANRRDFALTPPRRRCSIAAGRRAPRGRHRQGRGPLRGPGITTPSTRNPSDDEGVDEVLAAMAVEGRAG
jgi:phosphopentomutase